MKRFFYKKCLKRILGIIFCTIGLIIIILVIPINFWLLILGILLVLLGWVLYKTF